MDSNLQFEFSNSSSNLGKTGILTTSATTFFENLDKEKITEEGITSSVIFWMASDFTVYFSKTADDIVENNEQVILPRFETGIFW